MGSLLRFFIVRIGKHRRSGKMLTKGQGQKIAEALNDDLLPKFDDRINGRDKCNRLSNQRSRRHIANNVLWTPYISVNWTIGTN